MCSFDSISIGVLVIFIIVLFIELMHLQSLEGEMNEFDKLDTNGDGIISQSELAQAIKRELEKKHKQPPKLAGIIKSASSGALRGFLMGLLLNGLEGAITGSVVLAIINPIITSVEHVL